MSHAARWCRGSCAMPRYVGLKDFVRGCWILLKIHGNVPVFLDVGNGKVAAKWRGVGSCWGDIHAPLHRLSKENAQNEQEHSG